ncbi:hypothetical protein [Fulvivirga ligni]|uniref:hypothetical protein n=1 Tax=Fulvivirga ligni TaxID=2904246 RepID=UPI001F3E8673|nr:hypothetical protein [Fulvivirga ligni]UII20068.1 hypothetical protein LVD16_19675 [Fulvivirga ligni]
MSNSAFRDLNEIKGIYSEPIHNQADLNHFLASLDRMPLSFYTQVLLISSRLKIDFEASKSILEEFHTNNFHETAVGF